MDIKETDILNTDNNKVTAAAKWKIIEYDRDDRVLILEREALTTKEKLGSWVNCKIYQVNPWNSSDKHLVHEWKTSISLFHQDYANYEGMCLGPKLEDGSQVILLISDSQNRYSGFLSDWFKTLIVK